MPEEAPPPPEMESSAGKWLRENRSTNIVVSMEDFFARMFMAPARFVRENMVEPFRQKEVAPWYHRRYVLTFKLKDVSNLRVRLEKISTFWQPCNHVM